MADQRNALMPRAEARSYEFPWYQRVPHAIADWWYGDNLTAPQQQGVNTMFGTENPFNLPGRVSEGMDRSRSGYQSGDYGEMAAGLAEFGGAVAGPAMGAFAKMGPSVRGAARADGVAARREGAGRERAAMSEDGNKTVDNLTKEVNALGGRGYTASQVNDAIDMLDPVTRGMVRYGGLGSGRPLYLQPGHMGLQAGNLALQDYLWDAGLMPWSWNEPGTLQRHVREAPEEIAANLRYAGGRDAEKQPGGYYGNGTPDPREISADRPWEWSDVATGAGIGSGLAALSSAVTTPIVKRYTRALPMSLREHLVFNAGAAGLGGLAGMWAGPNFREFTDRNVDAENQPGGFYGRNALMPR